MRRWIKMIRTEYSQKCERCKTFDHNMYCKECVDKMMIDHAIEIFDKLYFGDSNLIIIGETPCLQTLNPFGEMILKHKYLQEFNRNFMKYFLRLAFHYTKGERGKFDGTQSIFTKK